MKDPVRNKILFVDDEPCMREVMAMLLNEEGYDVSTATDGLDALAMLRGSVPNLIISDLNMPRMSGQEFLSVVRHRFPAVPVIAISGASDISDSFPTGVMADAFYPKARCHPDELMRTVAELIESPVKRATNYHPCVPPYPQSGRTVVDSAGLSSIQLTCTDCLRAFSLSANPAAGNGMHETQCRFCAAPIRYFSAISLQVVPQAGLGTCLPA
jgi:CheY-like chemotaxis protein